MKHKDKKLSVFTMEGIVTTPGNAPTAYPAEYSISLVDVLPEVLPFSQVYVSHSNDYSLWNVGEKVTHPMKKFVMTGNSKEVRRELSLGYIAGIVGDFIAVHGGDDLEIEEHLVFTAESPLLSMAARIRNSSSSLLFTGVTDFSIYSSDIDDNGTFWYDSIISPLYPFWMVKDDPNDNVKNSTIKDTNDTSSSTMYTTRMVPTENESSFGYVKLDRVFRTNDTTTTNVIEDHLEKYDTIRRDVRNGKVAIVVFVILMVALVVRMLVSKNRMDYTPVP